MSDDDHHNTPDKPFFLKGLFFIVLVFGLIGLVLTGAEELGGDGIGGWVIGIPAFIAIVWVIKNATER